MKTADHAAPLELATVEDLKHKLSILSKIYAGKENEDNWDAREKAARQFRGLLRGNKKWADTLAGGVHDMAEGIIQSVNSLRTTLATETLALVADIGTCIGYQLDSYTTENLLQTLFKCANSTRKIIATKSMDSTNTFLSTTPLRHKTLKLLSDMFKDKNMQTRQFAATYVKTILNTHGNNPVLEKSGGLDMIESCLIKGLSDAAPIVRDICRQIFRDVQERWPARAQKLLKRLDPTVQKQLGKITPPPPSTKQHKSASKLDFSKRSTVLPKLQRTTSLPAASSSSSSPSERRTVSPIPRSTSPSASKRRSSPVVTQDVTRDMVQILRSGNVDAISKTILQLEESLRNQPFDFTCATPLPSNIPSRIDLAPIFLEFLLSNTSVQLRETLTGWEFVAGVLPHIVDPHQYIPIYISHSNQNTTVQNPKELPVSRKKGLYVEGLDKLKLLHGSRDSRLPARLLELLTAHIHSSIDEKYTLTMLQWIDEIICEYIGLAEETDPALRDSGKRWLVATEDVEPASKWFDSSEHVKLYLEKLLLLSNSIKTFPSLLGQISMIIGRLRLANEHVFESFSLKHGVALDEILNRQKEEHSRAQPVDQQEDDLDDVNSSVGSIRIDDDLALAETSATDKPHLATDTVDRDADGGETATQRMPSDTFAHEQVEDSEMIVDIDEPVLDFGSSPFKDNENKLQENNFDSQLISDLQVSRSESQVSVSETTETTAVVEKRSAPDDVSATRQKRRKLGSLPEDDKEQIRLLKHYIKGIQRPNEDEDIAFVTIQKLSEAKPVSTTDEVNSIHLWAGDRFFSLLEALIMVLVRSKSSDKLRLSALSLLGRLLQNQRGIIQQYEKMTTAVNESIVLILADALLSRIAHVDDEISSESQEVLAVLLKIVATSTALQVLWFLLSENQNNHGKMNALLQLLHPVIERTDQDALRDCFKGENLEIFLKGINHNEPSVRRSTVQVLAKVQQTVGQEFLAANIYPLLQQEQVELIKFYVQQ